MTLDIKRLCGLHLLLVLLPVMLLAGCASSPDTQFYTLVSSDAPSDSETRQPVQVARVQMPEYLDSNRLWVRTATHRIEAIPDVRWAESLPRASTRSLQQLLGAEGGSVSDAERLLVDLDVFEGRWNLSGEQDQAVMRGHWQLSGEAGSGQPIRLQVTLADREAQTLVAAQSRLLQMLAEDIAHWRRDNALEGD